MSLFRRVRDTFRPRGLDCRIDDEFQFHLEQRIDGLIAAGATPEEARRQALRLFGNRAHLHQSTRDRDLLSWLQSILQDVRFGCRNLRRSPMFTAVAVLSLAFGIGANAAIFTLVHGILLERLPVSDSRRIVQVNAVYRTFENSAFNYPIFRGLERQQPVFSEVIGFRSSPTRIDMEGASQRAVMSVVTGRYFQFFRARPALGRLIDDQDSHGEGTHRVCVLSFESWQRLFAGDPGILHRLVRVRGIGLQVVGVAPPDFTGPDLQTRNDLFVPISESGELTGIPQNSVFNIWLRVMGRIQPGLTLKSASARLEAASQAIEEGLSKDRANPGGRYRLLDASKGFDSWRTSLRDPLIVLMAAVGLVLLVACANLANLLLARASERRQEFAIKMAIGIGRWRLMRQLLLETSLLAAFGGMLAFLLSFALIRFLLDLFNAGSDYSVLHVSPNGTVLLFTFAVCLVTILLAGLYPAFAASRLDAAPGLKMPALGGRSSFMRRSLILIQVTLAVVLLFGASLFTHSLRNLKTIDLGYRIDHLLDAAISVKGTLKDLHGVAGAPEITAILDAARRLPGVESAAIVEPGPLTGGMMGGPITVSDPGSAPRDISGIHFLETGPGFFATCGIRLLRGRDFTTVDQPGAPWVALVNQRLAAQVWPGQDPIGKHLKGWNDKDYEVIGVAADSRNQSVRRDVAPTVYLAFDQQKTIGGDLVIRSVGGRLEPALRQLVKSVTASYEVSNVSSLELLRDNQIHQERLLAFLSSLFGALGTALALVGIYGLIAYSVKRRTREIGIRVSVGAQNRDVLWLFLRESSALLAAGMVIGIPLALLLARFVQKLLYQVTPVDSPGIAATIALLALGGLVASVLPARGALRVSPVDALRCD